MSKPNFGVRVTKGFAWTHLYKFAEYGLINLYNILVIRHFGPELVGPYALYLSAGTVLSLVGAFAVDGVLLRYVSHAFDRNEDKDDLLQRPVEFIQKLFAFRLLIITAISLLVTLGLGLVSGVFPDAIAASSAIWLLLPYVIVFLFCQAIIAFSTFTMMGLLEAKSVFTSSLIARGLLILLGFWAFSAGALDLERAVQIHILTCVVHAGLLLIAMKRTLRAHEQGEGFELFKGTVRHVLDFVRSKKVVAGFLGSAVIGYGITTWGTDILSTVLSRQPDILMLTALLGETSAQVGYYQVGAMVLLLAEYAMLFGFGGTLVAAFSALSREDELHSTQGSYPKLAAARKKVFGFHLAAATPLLVFILFFAKESVEVLFGAAFAPAAVLVQWGLVVLIVAVGIVGGGMHVTSLVSIGKQRSVFKIRLFWGLANLVGNYFLILSLGALGAVLGTQLANLGACAVESYVADKHIGSSRDHKAIVTVLAVALASVAIPWAVLQAVEIGALQSLIAGGVISLMLYLGISVLFKLSDVLHILDRLSVAFLKKPFPISAREVLS